MIRRLMALALLAGVAVVTIPVQAEAASGHYEWTCVHARIHRPAPYDLQIRTRSKAACITVYPKWFSQATGWSRFPSHVQRHTVLG